MPEDTAAVAGRSGQADAARAAPSRPEPDGPPGLPGTRLQWLLLLAGALLVFGSFNHAVWRKEALLRDGAVLRLALAPVDPRALMTGDYMALDYAVAAPLARQLQGRDGYAIVVRDDKGVGRLVRAQPAPEPREAGELALRARARGGRVRIGTDAWYFQEGQANLYENARFGEFRVGDDGEVLLVRMLDESLQPLGPAPLAAGR